GGERPSSLGSIEQRAAKEALAGEHVGADVVGDRGERLGRVVDADVNAKRPGGRDEQVAREPGPHQNARRHPPERYRSAEAEAGKPATRRQETDPERGPEIRERAEHTELGHGGG